MKSRSSQIKEEKLESTNIPFSVRRATQNEVQRREQLKKMEAKKRKKKMASQNQFDDDDDDDDDESLAIPPLFRSILFSENYGRFEDFAFPNMNENDQVGQMPSAFG